MILSSLENGKVIKTEARDVRFDLSCDVLCVGAGGAGVYASDAAAREGADVILCEIGANIGGMHVCGNVTGYYHGTRGGAHEVEHKKCSDDDVFFTHTSQWEQKQIHVTERLLESGVRVKCRHSAMGIYFDGNTAVGLRVFDGEKEINIKSGIIIDATSDGHIIRMTDVKKEYGRPQDGATVPFTVRTQYVNGKLFYSDNKDSGHLNQYDERDFSRKTIFAHANSSRLLSEGEFVNLALHTGVREGLTYEGEDCVRYGDIIYRRTPDKILFWAYSDLDRHGYDRAIDEQLFQDWWVISNLATVTTTIPVPMGSVVPKGIRGLVTAGRCMSCDTYSQSAVRMNRDMFRMGECVGRAAAMAVAQGVDFLAIDYSAFLARVRELGCFEPHAGRIFGFNETHHLYLNKMKTLGLEPDPKYSHLLPWENIYEPVEFNVDNAFHLLKTTAPGVAIWSCYTASDKNAVSERLYAEMTGTTDVTYKYNCAIALGILSDRRAVNALREIVEKRDCFYFTDNRRSNQFRSAVAICLLGRLGDKEDLSALYEILSDEEYEREMYHTLKHNYLYYPHPDRNFVYFDMLTHTCMALYKIYTREGLDVGELNGFFTQLFDGDKIMKRITSSKKGEQTYNEFEAFVKYLLKITK